jgi:hypothetical protein
VILQTRQVTVEVAHQLQISHGAAYEIIHNRLAFHKVCARWVPDKVTELHKEKCSDISKRLLDHCGAEGDRFLERTVMGDETWIHHYKPESKRQSMKWKHLHLPSKQKFRMHPTAGKFMLAVFWVSQGLLLEHYKERDSTVNSSLYIEMLSDKPKLVL